MKAYIGLDERSAGTGTGTKEKKKQQEEEQRMTRIGIRTRNTPQISTRDH